MIKQPNSVTEVLSVLAGLRFFFAMWVLFAHTYNFSPASRAMPVPSLSGLVAVLCFLVISGFSIRHSITKELAGYARRRFWRIFPVNVVSVTLAATAYIFLGPNLFDGYGTGYPAPSFWEWSGCYLLLQTFLPVAIPVLFPAWSLAIEIVYYSLAPILLRQRLRIVMGLAVASGAFNLALPYTLSSYLFRETSLLHALAFFWAWLIGWMAYGLPKDQRFAIFSIAIGGGLILWFPPFYALDGVISVVSTLLAWAGTVLVVVYRAKLPIKGRLSAVLIYLGELSFPLYLIHYPVLFALSSSVFKTHPEWNYGIVHVAISLVAAAAVYHLIEKPVRRFVGRQRLVIDTRVSRS